MIPNQGLPRLALFALSLAACVACGGSDDGGGGATDAPRDIAFDVLRPPDTAVADSAADSAAEDAPPPPECTVAGDCVTKVRTPLQCEEVRCDDGTCSVVPRADGAACDDGNACTSFDKCEAGRCRGGTNTCTCESNGDCAPFEDGDLCNGRLVCDTSSLPYGCVIDPDTIVACDTSEDTRCRQTACDPGTGKCVQAIVNVGELCDDDDPCTGDTRCTEEGECVGEERCQCRTDADCLPFEDEDRCNAALYCNTAQAPFVCAPAPGTEVRCSTANDTACRKNRCQPSTGSCVMVDQPDHTTTCNDFNGCTVGDHCEAGVCVPGEPKDCDDGEICTNDGCNPVDGQCQHVPNTQPCEHEFACSLGDVCDQGSCRRGEAIFCDDGDPCTVDACVEPTGCVFTPDPELCPPEDVVTPPEDVVTPPEDVVTPPEDIVTPPEDVVAPPEDATSWPSYATATMRVTSLGWGAPDLCYDLIPNEPCIPMDGTLSQEMAARLEATADPLVLLLRFEPLDLDATEGLVTIGAGACEAGAEGDVCALLPEGPTTNYGAPVFRADGLCLATPEIVAPCVETEAAPIELPALFLPPLGSDHTNPPFVLTDARVHARFTSDLTGVAAGVLRGFLTTDIVEGTRTDLTGFGATDLALLFENTPPEDNGGAVGWWVTLPFTAERVATPAR